MTNAAEIREIVRAEMAQKSSVPWCGASPEIVGQHSEKLDSLKRADDRIFAVLERMDATLHEIRQEITILKTERSTAVKIAAGIGSAAGATTAIFFQILGTRG
jgi:hypothetical protein